MTSLEEFTDEVHTLLSDRYGDEADVIASTASTGKIVIYFDDGDFMLTVSKTDLDMSAYELLTRLTTE
jgi:hypothetical protein